MGERSPNLKGGRSARLLIFVSATFAVLIALVASGAVDFLADDQSIGPEAVRSLVAYWLVIMVTNILVSLVVKRPREFVLALGAVVIVLLMSEVLLRVVSPSRAKMPFGGLKSSRYHHIYEPSVEMFMGTYDGHDVVVRTNEDGVRSDTSREEFLQKEERIILLGDSFVLGLGVRQEFTCAAVLEGILSARGKETAVLNTGVISYSPMLALKLFEGRLEAYRPTLVVLVLDVSDIGDDTHYNGEWRTGEGRFDFPDESRRPRYSAVTELIRPLAGMLWDNLIYPYYALIHSQSFNYDYYDFEVDIDGVVEKNRFFVYRHPLEKTRPYFERTLTNIKNIAGRVRQDGAEFALAIMPRHHHWSDRECPDNWEIKQYKYSMDDPYEFEYFRFFDEVADSVDFPIINLLPDFKNTDRFPLVFAQDPHWNQDGHAFVAELLARRLTQHGLLE